MAHILPIDTLNYANRLKSVNVPDNQAEMQAILAKEQNDNINSIINDNLATKKDIKTILWGITIGFSFISLLISIFGLLLTFNK